MRLTCNLGGKARGGHSCHEPGVSFCSLLSLNAALFEHYNLSQMTILGEGEHREGEGCRGGLTDDTLFPAS